MISGETYEVTFVADSFYTPFYENKVGGSGLIVDNISIKEYLGQEVVPDSGCGSWLFEPQSTNLIPYSEDFTVWNQIQNVTLISNSTASPSGENNATKFLSTTGSSKVRNNFSAVSGTTYTFSVYCKNIDATFVRLLAYDGLNEFSAYVVSQINTSTWTKVSLTFTATNTSGSGQVQIARDLPDGESLYFWGAQLEEQSYATSYIPTEGSTVTRNQDLCTNGGSLASINSTEGVLYAEIAAQANDLTDRTIALSDGTVSNTIRIQYLTVSNAIWATVTNIGAGGNQAVLQYTSPDITINSKVALKYKANDFSLWVNGIEVATDTSGVTFSANTLNTLQFDRGNGAQNFFGKTKCLAVFPYLSDSELQSLTTI